MAETYISGISSGIDWRNILDQLEEVERRPVELLQQRIDTYQEKMNAWDEISSALSSFMSTVEDLRESDDLNISTVNLSTDTSTDPEDLISVTTSSDASPGTYDIKILQKATAQKISSTTFASQTTELNISGDIIIGGKTVSISTSDTLIGIRDKINAVNSGTNPSGVTASILYIENEGYRLILTSDEEGSEGISILNGGANNVLGKLGFVDTSSKTIKNQIQGGNKSDRFSSSTDAIGDLLNLSEPQSGTVTIVINGNSQSVSIDLSTDSLTDIRDAINSAFSGLFSGDPASVITETVDGATYYRLLIEGESISYTDSNNILETLGILERSGLSDERGMTGDISNTSSGQYITTSTRFDQIDGYIDYETTDYITLSGTDTNGNTVNVTFYIYDSGTSSYKTIDDLLTEIENSYGNVTATITEDGKIRVIDNEIGDTDLQVVITPNKSSLKFDQDGDLGTITTIRKRQIQAGQDAQIEIDGETITTSSNTVDDIIPGVTLNLLNADISTTITLNIGRDYDSIKEKIQEMVDSYNEVMDAIDSQLDYDEDNQQPGGPLFGDSTLRNIRSQLRDIILNRVEGVDSDLSTLALIGINLNSSGRLTIDDDTLQDALENNFDDVRRLITFSWSSTNSHLTYAYHTLDTASGTYNLYIDTGGSPDDYFEKDSEIYEASVSGEYISSDSGDAKGLMVRYSGSDTGNVGSITLIYGVAEQFYRVLYNLTDPLNGNIQSAKEAISNNIDNLEDRIERLEDRIENRLKRLTDSFIKMEMALSQIQNQSNWLSGQISASLNGWGLI